MRILPAENRDPNILYIGDIEDQAVAFFCVCTLWRATAAALVTASAVALLLLATC